MTTPWPNLGQRLALDFRSAPTLEKVHANLGLAQRGLRFLGQVAKAAG